MRLIVTADLHYDLAVGRAQVEALAERACGEEADALVLAGDIVAGDPEDFVACLKLFEGFRGRKFLVAGNHDLWTDDGDSFQLYDEVIPILADGCGFHDLDAAHALAGDVGLVGTVGWYDYSFRDESLGIPLRFYEHKAAPGYARQHPAFAHLLDPAEALPPRALAAASYWNDGRMIHWHLDDHAFTELTVERLAAQIEAVEPHVRAIVAITHHIPFPEMLVRKRDPSWAFGNAFMGSACLGELLLRHEKVTHAVFGHSHSRGRERLGRIDALNVGCTYKKKRYVSIEV